MPLRNDPSLWSNLPGVVAAYQPVRAPDSLLARYNQAHGGDNRHRAEPGALPGWDPIRGWVFNGSTHYLKTGIIQTATNWSFVVRYSDLTTTGIERVFGSNNGSIITYLQPNNISVGQVRYANGSVAVTLGTLGLRAAGVIIMSDRIGYANGAVDAASISVAGPQTVELYLGCVNQNGSPFARIVGNIQAFAAYARPLSAAEVWHVTRQVQYCHANQDWSVWGRRRNYYYASGPAFLAAWASNSNSVIKQVGQ